MQIVNGYICMNCCDVDKARLGQDPHQAADTLKKQVEQRLDRLPSGHFGPAVNFGGSLQPSDASDSTDGTGSFAATPSQGTGSPSAAAAVNVIA